MAGDKFSVPEGQVYDLMLKPPAEDLELLINTDDPEEFHTTFDKYTVEKVRQYETELENKVKALAAVKVWESIHPSGETNVKNYAALVAFVLSDRLEAKKSGETDPFPSVPSLKPRIHATNSILPMLINGCKKDNIILFGQLIRASISDLDRFHQRNPDYKYHNAMTAYNEFNAFLDELD